MRKFLIEKRARGTEGFTLLELIVVITIIGILSTIVVVSTRGLPEKARRTKATQDLEAIVRSSDLIFTQTGKHPETIEEMVNAKDEQGQPIPGCLERFPKDPWNHEYLYEIVDGRPHAKCLGSDGSEGGDGEAMDIERPEADTR